MFFKKKSNDAIDDTPKKINLKRYFGITLSIILITIGLFILTRVLFPSKSEGQGALQVVTNVKSNVYLDNKLLGSTPLCKCTQDNTITTGEYTITITPDDKSLQSYTLKAKIELGVLTAIDKTFLPGAFGSSYVLNLEKIDSQNPELVVNSLPDGAMITLDGSPLGVTPYNMNTITASEHELIIEKPGYAKKTIKIRIVAGYRLLARVILGTDSGNNSEPTPIPTAVVTIAPTAGITPSPTQSAGFQVIIKNTPTGFLRVRSTPGGAEIAQVQPGESYPYIDEQTGWYEIKLKNGQLGWVSSDYAEKK